MLSCYGLTEEERNIVEEGAKRLTSQGLKQSNMSLSNRWQGAELSNVEKELIFKRRNTGFVKYQSKEGKFFSLHPSPFFQSLNNEIFWAESCVPPPENTFVEVDIKSEENKFSNSTNGWEKSILKIIKSWRPYDPNQIAQRRKLIDWEQIIQFFSHPFKGKQDIIEPIATCAALYAFSSPPITNEIGGINTAILSRKQQWDAIRKPLKIIPDEFFKTTSPHFYFISEKETIPKCQSEEINLAFLKPKKALVDIPIVIEDITIQGVMGKKKELLEEDKRLITAYLLDSLLLKPNPMESVENSVTEAVYVIRENYQKAGIPIYNQNLGDAIPKLTSSISRLQLTSVPKPDHVKEVLALWTEMHNKTKFIFRTPLKIADQYSLSENAKKLYVELFDVYGTDYWIPLTEILKTTTLKDDSDFQHAIIELIERGFAIRDKGRLKLLES